mgnify:CR=1 FL=1
MKNFTQRGMALLLSVLLLCSLSVGALAADDVALNATLNVEKLTKSEEAQTVTLTVAPASALNIAGYGFTVNLPEGWSIAAITNDDSNAPLNAGNYNLKTNQIGFKTADAENATISKFAEITISVPANTAAGNYDILINGVTADADYGTVPVLTNATTATATLTIEDGSVKPPEPVIPEGYSVAASGDAGINVGEEATVALNVTHKEGNAYNAYYFEVSYNKDVLTYKSAGVQDVVVDETTGTLKIAGYGANKDSGTAAATLTFTGKAVGAGKVTITKANVDAKANANAQDAPAANIDETTAAATITVGGYSVTLPEGFTGAASAEAGKDYTFTGGDDHGCYDVTATMGGETTTVTNNGDGSFTIKNVTGEIVVTATPKTYAVTVTGTGAGDVSENAATATYKTDYTFKLTKADGYNYTVTVTAGGNTVTATATTEGVYTISGADIKGELIITVEKTAIVIPTTTITITGDTDDVQGGLILTAKNGEDTTFKINKKDGYTYTVKAGDTELTVGADGTVTIPGSLLTGAPLTVTVTKTAVNPYSVEVYEYVKLDGQSIWLVVAKSDSVLAYGADTMFTSEKYGGYCWLVISAENADTVKTEAIAAVKAGSGTAAAVVYTGDVNATGKVDVNDAQLVYNIYNTEYASFDALSRAKFLAADVNGDHTVTVLDAAAVVNTVLGK